MIKLPLSQTTRRKALDAIGSLETEQLLSLVQTAKVKPFYAKTISESISRDEKMAKEWMQESSISITPARERRDGASDAQKMHSLMTRYESLPEARYGRPGGKRTGFDVNEATAETVGSAKAQGDTLRVAQPRLNMDAQKRTKEAIDQVFSSPGETSEDSGGSGYGF